MCSFGCYPGKKAYGPESYLDCKDLYIQPLVRGGLSQANIQNMKLNPGDVMFETGQKNGRYKGIYHVEMITGYLFYGFDGNGKAELGIQWATGDEKYYPMGQMVGRP